jgi:CheY-like chemotaxis protein
MEPKHILIIDDEEAFSFFVKLNLESDSRFKVSIANCGENGIEIAREAKPDLILIDILMPGMLGPEVAGRLISDSRTKDIPIAFLTASVLQEEVEKNKGMIGGRAFIAKPITREDIISRVAAILNLQ